MNEVVALGDAIAEVKMKSVEMLIDDPSVKSICKIYAYDHIEVYAKKRYEMATKKPAYYVERCFCSACVPIILFISWMLIQVCVLHECKAKK